MISDRCYERYWSVILALVFLTLGSQAAPAKEIANQAPKNQVENRIDNSDASSAPRPIVILETPEQAKASERREAENRQQDSRDLDVQMRAADATERQITPAWIAAILSFAGTVLIVVTLFLTRDANRLARDTAYRQLRAYMTFEEAFVNIESQPNGWTDFKGTLLIRNSGQTPAIIRSEFMTSKYGFNGGGGGSGSPEHESNRIISPNAPYKVIGDHGTLIEGEDPGAQYQIGVLFTYEDFRGVRHTEVIQMFSEPFVAKGFNGRVDLHYGSHEPGPVGDFQWPWHRKHQANASATLAATGPALS